MPKLATSCSTSQSPHVATTAFKTELGWMAVVACPWKVRGLVFGHKSKTLAQAALAKLTNHFDKTELQEASQDAPLLDLDDVIGRLEVFASGEPTQFADVPISAAHLAPFSQRVLHACRELTWGETASYGELAARCGRPGAARAVGTVMSGNRYPLIVPCHRVLGSGGKLGGYSAPDGLDMKRRLLAMEASEV